MVIVEMVGAGSRVCCAVVDGVVGVMRVVRVVVVGPDVGPDTVVCSLAGRGSARR
jgi:hypothetical protein